jgi:carbon storage regulator CsrA
MLILERKPSQKLILTHQGVEITVMVTKVRGNRVRLGVTAPESVQVRRAELKPKAA